MYDLNSATPVSAKSGFIGYGTKSVVKKFCVPNLNQLPVSSLVPIDKN